VEAAAAHNAGKRYFLGETNSGASIMTPVGIKANSHLFAPATCGGGGISPTFGSALWIVDYSIQAALNGVERLYFHQGTIGNCVSSFFG
jgi:hypothetical protein